ncbi:transporter substrate-binding domain-containing protein [Sulfitobacter mediterraneus]|jgi:polar amino acid transport system substrate-binding protein|uniref:transporter substrate-binding domain-containing protein n=1 Tax=Sulfitobacter TaxID=60136 RepID=UPI001932F40B|nr:MULTISPECIES: transporter substrate-binding domain-containing protein [Sulfitobacter]MBM1634325.1 transporter substrate-binding domain-containing protein [Sulfitobacter mediterraneus]MBM1642142.1 transporter substrate-binding domain-containing protein [Sulfitobacter mediterraneus]MBM1646191.1 transporter substrate-binding domain-containing protein [Sulfitobacter mediterraneus]MBM1650237.1 transporter substrate-binding domain-containing protein [Sulfitobacter mediterraneus]MBM1654259.1 trans
MVYSLIKSIVVAAVCTISTTAWAGETFDRIMSSNKMTVGVAPWNGFVAKNPSSGEFEGLIVDDIAMLSELTGIEIELINTTWSGLIAGLQAGKWDVIMTGMGATPERSKAVAFTDGWGFLSPLALVGTDSPFQTSEDLNQEGNKITVVSGTSAHRLAARVFDKAEVASYSDTGAAVLEVMQGQAAAYIGDSISNTKRAEERSELRALEFDPSVIEWNSLNHAVRYDDPELLVFLNTYIHTMQLRGWYVELAERWGMPASLATGPN